MGVFSSSRYLIAFCVLNLYFKAMAADANMAFSFNNFGQDSSFEPHLALYGDAKVVNHTMSVQISGSRVSSAGRVISKKPINIVGDKSRSMVSFSTYFTFSMSRESGDGLAFVMLPVGFPYNYFDGGSMGLLRENKMKFLAVEFDAFMDEKYGDVNDNHIGVDVESPVSVKVSNVSSLNMILRSGEKLQSWINYEASGKRLEVRLSKFGGIRPVDPLLSYPIDLSKMWRDDNVFVGLSSSSGNSTQKITIYSWSFETRTAPQWMHSEPVDPNSVIVKGEEDMRVPKRSDNCTSRIIVALVFGAGCGVLGAFFVLLVWTIVGNKRPVPVVPEEFAAAQAKEYEYKKFNACDDVEKSFKDGEK